MTTTATDRTATAVAGQTPPPSAARAWVRLLCCLGVATVVLLLAPMALAAPLRLPGDRPHRSDTTVAGPQAAPRPVAAVAAWTTDAVAPAVAAVLPSEEQADRLTTDIQVDADGSVVVTETIRWRFPEGEERHGILRNVKVRVGYQGSESRYRYYELTGVTVTSPSGAPTDIAISDFGAFRQIRVGSPSQTVSGTADYVVRYRLAHVVNDIGDGTAELYYDIVDVSNSFPQKQVSATVTGPVTVAETFHCGKPLEGSTTL